MEDDLADLTEKWELTPTNNAISLAIVGKTGNGKSSTGNSILGRQAFISDLSLSAVTSTSELQSAILKDGRTVNIIDTPGLYDLSIGSVFVGREIVKCIDLAQDGLHAILMVFSINSRFTKEEAASIQAMKTIFGDEIVDYMIVVFTGGDVLESNQKTLKEYTSQCPKPLKNIIDLCKNRVIFFDNKTNVGNKREEQVDQLLSLVDSVISSNGGKPFSNQMFAQVKEEALYRQQMEKEIETSNKGYSEKELSELKKDINKSYDDQLKRMIESVEQKLNSTIEKLEKQLAEEQAARLEAQKVAEASRLRSDEENKMLKEDLKRAWDQTNELQKQAENQANELRKQAEDQANELRKQAEEQANEYRKQAEDQANEENKENKKLKEDLKRAWDQTIELRKQAENQANELRKQAEDQANELRKQAADQANEFRKQAEDQANELRKQTEKCAIL